MPNFIQEVQIYNIFHPNKLFYVQGYLENSVSILCSPRRGGGGEGHERGRGGRPAEREGNKRTVIAKLPSI